ncbi:hypothetical protein [Streptomyces bullii]|uniref:Uncharacterized protein n=1 Tax=Streptomyces bullii TaxID=349910 RepID=A0ABW0USR8_9ACTN
MGDYFQTIVDLDAGEDEAPRLAQRVVDWLVAEGIVLAEREDCVLGQPLGHPPGPHWERAAAEDDADWEPTDGLAVHTGRTVFDGGQDAPEAVTCPRCATTTPLDADPHDLVPDDADGSDQEHPGTAGDGVWPRFVAAITDWRRTGAAAVDCPACAQPVPLPEWVWADDCFAVGHLGFEFWNWPEFTPRFRTRIAELLDGHRTAYVWGKL